MSEAVKSNYDKIREGYGSYQGEKPAVTEVTRVSDRPYVRNRFRKEWDRFKHLLDRDDPVTASSGQLATEDGQSVQPIKKTKPGKMLWPPAPSRGFWEKKKDSA